MKSSAIVAIVFALMIAVSAMSVEDSAAAAERDADSADIEESDEFESGVEIEEDLSDELSDEDALSDEADDEAGDEADDEMFDDEAIDDELDVEDEAAAEHEAAAEAEGLPTDLKAPTPGDLMVDRHVRRDAPVYYPGQTVTAKYKEGVACQCGEDQTISNEGNRRFCYLNKDGAAFIGVGYPLFGDAAYTAKTDAVFRKMNEVHQRKDLTTAAILADTAKNCCPSSVPAECTKFPKLISEQTGRELFFGLQWPAIEQCVRDEVIGQWIDTPQSEMTACSVAALRDIAFSERTCDKLQPLTHLFKAIKERKWEDAAAEVVVTKWFDRVGTKRGLHTASCIGDYKQGSAHPPSEEAPAS